MSSDIRAALKLSFDSLPQIYLILLCFHWHGQLWGSTYFVFGISIVILQCIYLVYTLVARYLACSAIALGSQKAIKQVQLPKIHASFGYHIHPLSIVLQ